MKIILAVIGGGSVNWMKALMKDVYLLDEVDGGEIRLVDPQVEHAKAVADMLNAYNKMRNKSYKISVIKDRKGALKGADIVMTTFSPGTMDAFFNDLEIPIKYGIRQPVSMTVGPGGISAALRTAPVAYEIVEDMEEVCPGAWLLNVTNPMSVVTRAMNMAARTVKVVGMCHEFHGLCTLLKNILGVDLPDNMGILGWLYQWLPAQGFEYTVAGINHFIWLTELRRNGEDLIPKIYQYAEENWNIPEDDKLVKNSPWSNLHQAKLALCRHFGYLPIVGDRHLVEFWPGLCNVQNGYAMKYGVLKTTVDHRRHVIEKILGEIRGIARGEKEMVWETSGEEMTEIMRAIITNRQVTGIVNMPNTGQISNLSRDVVVETLATISSDGVVPKSSGELPGPVGSLCRLHVDVHELTLRAAFEGSRKILLQALSLDPLSGCADFSELKNLAEDLLQANKQWLPRFFTV
jgi:alpha-galactosidase